MPEGGGDSDSSDCEWVADVLPTLARGGSVLRSGSIAARASPLLGAARAPAVPPAFDLRRAYRAVQGGAAEEVAAALEGAPSLLDALAAKVPGEEGRTLLHAACLALNRPAIEWILEAEAQRVAEEGAPDGALAPRVPLTTLSDDVELRTPLHCAIAALVDGDERVGEGDAPPDAVLEVVQLLLGAAPPEVLVAQDLYGRTPLHVAVVASEVEVCRLLLDAVPAAALWVRTTSGDTPLHQASRLCLPVALVEDILLRMGGAATRRRDATLPAWRRLKRRLDTAATSLGQSLNGLNASVRGRRLAGPAEGAGAPAKPPPAPAVSKKVRKAARPIEDVGPVVMTEEMAAVKETLEAPGQAARPLPPPVPQRPPRGASPEAAEGSEGDGEEEEGLETARSTGAADEAEVDDSVVLVVGSPLGREAEKAVLSDDAALAVLAARGVDLGDLTHPPVSVANGAGEPAVSAEHGYERLMHTRDPAVALLVLRAFNDLPVGTVCTAAAPPTAAYRFPISQHDVEEIYSREGSVWMDVLDMMVAKARVSYALDAAVTALGGVLVIADEVSDYVVLGAWLVRGEWKWFCFSLLILCAAQSSVVYLLARMRRSKNYSHAFQYLPDTKYRIVPCVFDAIVFHRAAKELRQVTSLTKTKSLEGMTIALAFLEAIFESTPQAVLQIVVFNDEQRAAVKDKRAVLLLYVSIAISLVSIAKAVVIYVVFKCSNRANLLGILKPQQHAPPPAAGIPAGAI